MEITKMPNLRNGSKGDSNPGSLDCESGILVYHWAITLHIKHYCLPQSTVDSPFSTQGSLMCVSINYCHTNSRLLGLRTTSFRFIRKSEVPRHFDGKYEVLVFATNWPGICFVNTRVVVSPGPQWHPQYYLQSPIRRLHQFIACILIYSTKWP